MSNDNNMIFVVDRIEGTIAVLVSDDMQEAKIVRAQLGVRVSEGTVLRVPVLPSGLDWQAARVDSVEREKRVSLAREALTRLQRKDPGGDISL